jgi:hypothetical protein
VSVPDFEIDVSLRARRLMPLVPPDAEVSPEGVEVDREQVGNGLPEEIEPAGSYERVEVSKRLQGVLR